MAQATLNAQIVLMGRVDNTVGRIGQALIGIGTQINMMTRQLVDFAKESVEVYSEYEDNMLAAETSLARIYKFGSREIKDVMTDLDHYARDWAASSIFHADDVSAAINSVAHAGWDLDQIIQGIPASMRLAQAGSLDLATATDYIVKSANAAGIAFDDLDDFVDQWVYAANSSAGDVESFGEAMLKMGGTIQFADGTEELLTLLAALHDAGTTGANAGTLLRNTMIRLVAPTNKAKDMMESLEISQDEWDEALGDQSGDLASAAKSLERYGFSAYDSQGDLKGFLQIFSELNDTLGLMETEEERNNVIAAIFPTRMITGALNLLNAASDAFGGLYDQMLNGAHEGYAGSSAELMMSGYTGALETLKSKAEELKLTLGANLEGDVITVAGNLGAILDHIDAMGRNDNGVSAGLGALEKVTGFVEQLTRPLENMDNGVLDVVSEGLGTLALTGSAFIAGGTFLKILGWLGGAFTGGMLAAAGIGAVWAALNKWNEVKYNSLFGDMDLDATALNEALQEEATKFDAVWSRANNLKETIKGISTEYQNTAKTLSSDLLSAAILGKELSEADVKAINDKGAAMSRTLREAIIANGDYNAAFWTALFSYNADGSTESDEDVAKNPIYQAVIDILNTGRDDLLLQVDDLDKRFSQALSDALFDHEITDAERAELMEYFREYNALMAQAEQEAKNEQDYITRQQMLHKAQSLSWSAFETYNTEELIPERERQLQTINDQFDAAVWGLQYRYENGQLFNKATGAYYTQDEYNALIAGVEQERAEAVAGVYGWFDDIQLSMADAMLEESELADEMDTLKRYMGLVNAGMLTWDEAYTVLNNVEGFDRQNIWDQILNRSDETSLSRTFRTIYGMLGGDAAVVSRMEQYKAAGATEQYERLKSFYDIGHLLGYAMNYEQTRNANEGEYAQRMSLYYLGMSNEELARHAAMLNEYGVAMPMTFMNLLAKGGTNEATARQSLEYYKNDPVVWAISNEIIRRYFAENPDARNNGVSEYETFGAFVEDMIDGTLGLNAHRENEPEEDARMLFPVNYAFGSAVLSWLEGTGAYPGAAYERDENDDDRATSAYVDAAEAILEGAEVIGGAERDFVQKWEESHFGLNSGKDLALADEWLLYNAFVGNPNNGVQFEVGVGFPDAKRNATAANSEIQNAFKDVKVPVSFIGGGGSMGGGMQGGIVSFANLFGGAKLYARGGRADTPSVFGEAGPEWAIPEEHSMRTAALLAQAAAASGFEFDTISDADPAARNVVTVEYAPVIHAEDARGVESALRMDKERFLRMFREALEERELSADVGRW